MSNTNKRRIRRARGAQGTRRARGKRKSYRYSSGGKMSKVKIQARVYEEMRNLENQTKRKSKISRKPLRPHQLGVLNALGLGSSELKKEIRKYQTKVDKYNEALAKKTAKTLYTQYRQVPTVPINPGFVSNEGYIATAPFVTHAQPMHLLPKL